MNEADVLKTVTSVSGGKTSAYMALHYPTDFYIFACVLTNHEPSISTDKGLTRECTRRIPHFVASHEDDRTLRIVLQLEQELGREIKWVAADFSLEDYVKGTTDLPGYRTNSTRLFNSLKRFCTVEQKIKPIIEHCYSFVDAKNPVIMNLGFRYDEPKRVEQWKCKNDKTKLALSCPVEKGNWRYLEYEWRISDFPLYRDRVTHESVRSFWLNKGWEFPEISNCRFCPFHTDTQLQRQSNHHPGNLGWWLDLEKTSAGHTFGKRPLLDRLNQPLLNVYESPCHCTD